MQQWYGGLSGQLSHTVMSHQLIKALLGLQPMQATTWMSVCLSHFDQDFFQQGLRCMLLSFWL
jgi:hypothetical protein